ncbi:MAG TPA: prolyl oligopeptidase family serine peptidase [Candidatus Baltobacteraceae bacterium]|nr:prolyl oligopeptidase family serine peptidase [Candidatus Baltobacteraceae bacterium]
MAGRPGPAGPSIAPYGSWSSPISVDLIAAGRAFPTYPRFDADDVWWEEPRPAEGGRQVGMHRPAEGSTGVAVPPGVDVRTMVHEYGGAAWTVAEGTLYYSDVRDGRLYRIRPGGGPEPLTVPGPLRYADIAVDAPRGRLICVGEDHSGSGEAVNRLITVDLDSRAPVAPEPLVQGADFYAAPRLSPDGRRLAWLSWSHPSMPWDGTTLWVGALGADGDVTDVRRVAGGDDAWIAQPRWSPDGELYFVGEATGWMNLYRWRDGASEPVLPMAADFARPDWVFGVTNYAFVGRGEVLAVGRDAGRDRAWRVAPTGAATELTLPLDEIDFVAGHRDRVLLAGDSAADAGGLAVLDLATGGWSWVTRSLDAEVDPGVISIPRSIDYPTTEGAIAHALFYPPRNDAFAGPVGTRPPLIVTSHGGPTASAGAGLRLGIQYFTSRGLAVVDVDYRGSTGYGKAYRRALEGRWGVYDMDDCAAAAAFLVAEGLVDGGRVAIRGGSASGYTTLCALTFRDDFRAGVSYFGIGDLETFARDTHKFESRYLDRLVGPYPAARDLYVSRSPVHFLERLSCPLLIVQGLDDRVVPPSQAEQMVTALAAKGLPYAYLPFEGEGHGLRRAANVRRATEAELAFYGRVFGFRPADDVPPLELVLPSTPAAQGAP